MKVGIMAGATSAFGNVIVDSVEFTINAEKMGFDSVWMANIFGPDAIHCSWHIGFGLGAGLDP